MADLRITEFDGRPTFSPFGDGPEANEPALEHQTVLIGAAALSTAFNIKTNFVRLYPEATCYVLFGTAPTATVAAEKLAADVEYFRTIEPGTSLKLSVHDGVT